MRKAKNRVIKRGERWEKAGMEQSDYARPTAAKCEDAPPQKKKNPAGGGRYVLSFVGLVLLRLTSIASPACI